MVRETVRFTTGGGLDASCSDPDPFGAAWSAAFPDPELSVVFAAFFPVDFAVDLAVDLAAFLAVEPAPDVAAFFAAGSGAGGADGCLFLACRGGDPLSRTRSALAEPEVSR